MRVLLLFSFVRSAVGFGIIREPFNGANVDVREGLCQYQHGTRSAFITI